MNDPLASIAAPPPRYLLESDSSDEEGQGTYGSSRVPKIRTAAPAVTVSWHDDAQPVSAAVVGVGQAGKYLLRRSGARMALLSVEVGGDAVGTGFALGDGGLLLVLADRDEKGEAAFEVVEKVVAAVKAESWTIFSSYVPALYIPGAAERSQSADPPVRVLSTGSSAPVAPLKPYDAPNYVTGLAGAFLSQAAHPAFALSAATLFVLPLPLSRIAPAGVNAAVGSLSAAVAAPLTKSVRWTEADDEPYTGIGMGARRAHKEVVSTSADVGGMYM